MIPINNMTKNVMKMLGKTILPITTQRMMNLNLDMHIMLRVGGVLELKKRKVLELHLLEDLKLGAGGNFLVQYTFYKGYCIKYYYLDKVP